MKTPEEPALEYMPETPREAFALGWRLAWAEARTRIVAPALRPKLRDPWRDEG